MKHFIFVLLVIMLLPSAACTGPISSKSISGKIIDAETGQPIDGAILLVEWSKTHGFGNTYTTSEKVVEIFSDMNGIVTIPGYDGRFVNEPDVTIYKPGYVAWNNHWIFPDRKNRTDFVWKNDYVFRLDKFKEGYSYVKHESFVSLCTNIGMRNPSKKLLWDLYSRNEEGKYLLELRNSKK